MGGKKSQRMSTEKKYGGWDCHMFVLSIVEFQFHFQIFLILEKLLVPRRGKAAM